MGSLLIILSTIACFNITYGQISTYPSTNPIELGKVAWLRDYEEAIRRSKSQDLPVFLLFQEVPGCSNCTTFGNEILSHPLFVEAVESCFIPLCIYNNQGGKDAEILRKYNEPAWNNPVIRIVDMKGKDIVQREGDFRSQDKIVNKMIEALQATKTIIPRYLTLLSHEWMAKKDEAYLSMYCFWTGEKEISSIEGVVATEAGYMHGHEVVKVTFDRSQTNIESIANKAKKVNCADEIYGTLSQGKISKPIGTYQRDRDDKYYLSKSKYKAIPMTDIQKTKVNSAIGSNEDPTIYLSPRQLALLSNKDANKKNYIDRKIEDIWYRK